MSSRMSCEAVISRYELAEHEESLLRSRNSSAIEAYLIQTNLTPLLKVTTSLGGASLDRFDPQFIAKIGPQYTLYYNLKSSFYVSIGTTFQFSKYKFGNLFQATPSLTIGIAEPSISLNIGYNASQATK